MAEDADKQCPFCGERIKAAALKCRFCGEFLEAQPPPERPAALQGRAAAPAAGPTAPVEVFYEGHVSWISLAGAAARTALWLAFAGAAQWVVSSSGWVEGLPPAASWVPPVIALGALVYGAYRWIAWKHHVYRITTERVEVEQGVFARTVQNLDLWRIQDIAFHQSLVERLIGVGRLFIMTSDRDAPTLWVGPVPGGRALYDQLKRAQLDADRRRGVLHVEH